MEFSLVHVINYLINKVLRIVDDCVCLQMDFKFMVVYIRRLITRSRRIEYECAGLKDLNLRY